MTPTLHAWDTFRRGAVLLLAHRALWPTALVLGLGESAGFLTPGVTPGLTPGAPGAPADLGALVWPCLLGIFSLAVAVVTLAATVALLVLATDRAQGGTLPVGAAWRQGWARWWPAFVFGLLLGLYLLLPVLLLLILALVLFGTAITGPGFTVWIGVATLLLGVLVAPVSGLGECRVGIAWQTPSAGLRRAWALFQVHSGPLLGLALLQALIPGLVGLLPALLLTFTPLALPDLLVARLVLWPLATVVLGFMAGWTQVTWALAHLTLDPPPAPVPAPALPPIPW